MFSRQLRNSDVEPVQLVQHLQEMSNRTRQAVTGPDQDDIKTAAAGLGHHPIQTGTLCLDAADPVGVFVHDLVTALGGELAQVVELRFWMLIDGRDPQVKGGALHAALRRRRNRRSTETSS